MITFWVIFSIVAFVLLVSFWAYECINILKPNEIGIKLTFGKPAEINEEQPVKSGVGPGGLHFAFWPVQKIKRYTNDIMEFHFTTPSVITRRGAVAGYGNGAVEPAEINIICTLYAQFDVDSLHNTVKYTGANNAQTIGRLIIPYAIDAIRALGSRVPWRLINQERHHAAQWVIARLIGCNPKDYPKKIDVPKPQGDDKPDLYGKEDPNDYKDDVHAPTREKLENSSPFVQTGLINVVLAVEDINFTNEEQMREALTAKERARLEAGATREKADAEKYKRQEEGKGSANARKKMIEAIKENPELEALLTMSEMAKGTSNTIMYQIPPGLAETMSGLLGGNDISRLFSQLSDEQKTKFIKGLQGAIKK